MIISLPLVLFLSVHLASPPSGDALPFDSARSPLTPGREGRGFRGGDGGGSGSHSHHHNRYQSGVPNTRNLSPRHRGGSVGEERNGHGRGSGREQRSQLFSFSEQPPRRGEDQGEREENFSFSEVNRASLPLGSVTPQGNLDDGYDPLQARSMAALSTLEPEVEIDERVAAAAARVPDIGSGPRVLSPQRMSSKHRMSSKELLRKQQAQQSQQQPQQGEGQGQKTSSTGQRDLSETPSSLSQAGGGVQQVPQLGSGSASGPGSGSASGAGSVSGTGLGPERRFDGSGSNSPDRRNHSSNHSNPTSPLVSPSR